MLHLSCGFCSSANTSLPTDDLSIHHLSRCQRGSLSLTPHPSTTARLLTFDAPLGARGLAPAVAALPPAHIDPAGTANKDQCPAGQPRSPPRAGRRGGRWAAKTEGGKHETSRLNSTPPSCTGPAAHSRHGGSWPRARPHVPRMLGALGGRAGTGAGQATPRCPRTAPPPSPPSRGGDSSRDGGQAAAGGCGGGAGAVRDGRGLTPAAAAAGASGGGAARRCCCRGGPAAP